MKQKQPAADIITAALDNDEPLNPRCSNFFRMVREAANRARAAEKAKAEKQAA